MIKCCRLQKLHQTSVIKPDNSYPNKFFSYDGQGPDAYFYAGEHGQPSRSVTLFITFYPSTISYLLYENLIQQIALLLITVFAPGLDISLQMRRGALIFWVPTTGKI